MTALAPPLTTFLREYLPRDCGASAHTVANYATGFKRFLHFVCEKQNLRPCLLKLEDFNIDLILDFLDHLENHCGNSVRTRNLRLAAIKSFFRYLEFRETAYLDLARQVHAIPLKRFDEPFVEALNREEIQTLLEAPDPHTFSGIRDRAMFHLAYSAGLRVSELIQLTPAHLREPNLDAVQVLGKGRRTRILPLLEATKPLLGQWLRIRPEQGDPPLFLNTRATAMTRQGVNHRLAVHLDTARKQQPSLLNKRVSPHTLRHSCALHTLESTGDIRKVSLWLGHASIQSTEIYLRMDPSQKREMMAAGFPADIRAGTFSEAPDRLMVLLGEVAKP